MNTKGKGLLCPFAHYPAFYIYRQLWIVGIDNLGVNVYVDKLPYIGIGLSVFYYICNADHTSWSDKMKENNIYSNLLTLILIL